MSICPVGICPTTEDDRLTGIISDDISRSDKTENDIQLAKTDCYVSRGSENWKQEIRFFNELIFTSLNGRLFLSCVSFRLFSLLLVKYFVLQNSDSQWRNIGRMLSLRAEALSGPLSSDTPNQMRANTNKIFKRERVFIGESDLLE